MSTNSNARHLQNRSHYFMTFIAVTQRDLLQLSPRCISKLVMKVVARRPLRPNGGIETGQFGLGMRHDSSRVACPPFECQQQRDAWGPRSSVVLALVCLLYLLELSVFPIVAQTGTVAGGDSLPKKVAAINEKSDLFATDNLMAWCIVPFDSKKRSPEERALMLRDLGIRHFAYDYRAEHIPLFDREIEASRKHGVSIDAWWFPTVLNDEAKTILATLKRHRIRPQLWVTGGGGNPKSETELKIRLEEEVGRLRPICAAALELGCKVGLYNHGGWFGEPENQVQIIERLQREGISNVGIVYNLHHGHDHLDRFESMFGIMKPYLIALNLNGMAPQGDKLGKKILPIGQGELDSQLLVIIHKSGWRGLIGILNHTDEDAEARLKDNLEGLTWLVGQLEGRRKGQKPVPQSWRPPVVNKPSTSR